MKPYNLIFIMSDQQRADSVSSDSQSHMHYPVQEKLASESISFTNFFTAAMACVPSRHSFITGRQPWILGCYGNEKFAHNTEETWMSILRRHGYNCVSVGKTHMMHAGSFHIQIPAGRSFGKQKGYDHFHPTESPEARENYFDIKATSRACEALERLKEVQPFSLFLGFHAPHEPYVMPKEYLSFCSPDDVKLPSARSDNEYMQKSQAYRERVDFFQERFGKIDDSSVRKGIAGYHCLLKMVDDCLGTVLSQLRRLHLLDNTLLVYCSDHGDLLGEHHIFNKAATFHEGEIRIPMMIRFPDGYKAGTNINHLASSIDFAPTLFDILEIEADLSLPGYSLLPMIQNNTSIRSAVTCSNGKAMMIRTHTHKFWYHHMHEDGEMYDLVKDPLELHNLYNKEDHRDMRQEFTQQLLHIRMRDDLRNSTPTKRDKQRKQEVWSSFEPEVGLGNQAKKSDEEY